MSRIVPVQRPVLLLLAFCCLLLSGRPALAETPVHVAAIYVQTPRELGWTAAHRRGMETMTARLGGLVAVEHVENVDTGEQAETVLRGLAARGIDVVFATSLVHAEATEKVAREYPGVRFMQCSGRRIGPNLGTYTARMEQAEYLAGYAAGLLGFRASGTVATLPEPDVVRGINAFTLGLLRGLKESGTPHDPARVNDVLWLDAWSDPAREYSLALDLAGWGRDLVRQMADTPETSRAACSKNIPAVGHALDVSALGAPCALTSTVFNWSPVYEAQVRAVNEGIWIPQRDKAGIREGVVDLAPFGTWVPSKVREKVLAERARMLLGEDASFAGPVADQAGTVRIPAGRSASDHELDAMNWFVRGVRCAPFR
ncbi:BMP family ABC transporter substrate-binding protein [Desulfovibrio aminophilus]|nr:BMP family ABC transporter substrate-binding protein [Desulfovibrio aminophilus]MCM0754034.1 BMP family ABC transporter substrate-binding protein [Desulfovibrio aminophilus]